MKSTLRKNDLTMVITLTRTAAGCHVVESRIGEAVHTARQTRHGETARTAFFGRIRQAIRQGWTLQAGSTRRPEEGAHE